ncbi:hypothetical protein MP638_004401 [Amoeboaphelidium occidentale]|nr:hypothetical protein MP638_004401 [Amoeboaphelidium occidentale]
MMKWGLFKRFASSRASALEYCRDLTKRMDSDAYLSSLYLKDQSAMRAQWVIRAFNAETSMIRDIVSKDEVGKMRILWWKQALNDTYAGKPPENPVLVALHDTLANCDHNKKLSKSWFLKILNAREANLGVRQYYSEEDLEDYLENTQSCMLYLTLESFGHKSSHLDHIASHLGKAIGLVQTLRAAQHNSLKNLIYLPAETMVKHSISTTDYLRFFKQKQVANERFQEQLSNLVFDISSRAHSHMMKHADEDALNKEAKFLKLFTLHSKIYLKLLEQNKFDLLKTNRSMMLQQWKIPFKLYFV